MTIRGRITAALAAIVLLAGAPAFARGFLQSPEILDKIKPGVTTAQDVEQILGPPANRSQFPRLGLVSMDYVTRVGTDVYDIGVMITKDGVVKEVQRIMRYRGGP
jgi:outer membrane protein assembly factor BamE (lipoprotein component of BamABCDE complex)